MNKLLEIILPFISKNIKRPGFRIFIIMIIVFFFIIYPFIDANLFSYNRIEKRIKILQEIQNINLDKIENSILKKEYNSILSEIDKQKEMNFLNLFSIVKNNTYVNCTINTIY
ncbi:MAG: hypothetical protein AB9835_02725 [Eubacteriales bacterium]